MLNVDSSPLISKEFLDAQVYYVDGKAGERAVEAIEKFFGKNKTGQ